jgi:branched-subunit amino acid aminotransferase/4-amino-4-deoxychorismate lyase
MIWVRGKVVPDQALQVSALDRAFEHGLGLFETFRTWNGHPVLLGRHLERIRRSARELGLPLDDDDLPDVPAVSHLIEANRDALAPGQAVRLRLTLSAGLSTTLTSSSVLWMTAKPLPPPTRLSGAVITQSIQVARDDPLTRHKTLNYWRKRIALAQAVQTGSDDVLSLTPDGLLCETCRANVFLVESRRLLTPGLEGPLLPGVMRGLVLERARRLGIEVEEGPLPLERISTIDEAFMTNSLWGMLPIARLLDRELPARGPLTRQLWDATLPWLQSGGTTP